MTDLPLHTKYRPKTFEEVMGNDATVESLRSTLQRETGRPHAFLLQGPSGCGKSTLARIIAKELGCGDMEFKELNAANVRGIDTIRTIIDGCQYRPLTGKCRVYVLDEAAKLTSDAQNALLKILEDPPSYVYFILCTTDPEKLIRTIRTRCTTFQVATLQRAKMYSLLERVCRAENIQVPADVMKQIVWVASGSPRKALVLLDQVRGIEEPGLMAAAITESYADESAIIDICRILAQPASSTRWQDLSPLLRDFRGDPEQARYAIMSYLEKVLLSTGDKRIGQVMGCFMDSFMYTGKPGLVYCCFLSCSY